MATKRKVSSAVKAYRQNIKRRDHNRQLRSRLRTALKAIRAGIDAGDVPSAKAALTGVFSLVEKLANKGIIQKIAAGRYKSRLVKRASVRASAA